MDIQLESNDPLTIDIVEAGVVTWEDLIRCVRTFHYGRNANRSDFSRVWYERRGTCSSKHAFLKHIADLNNIPNVDLILCMYKMNESNTPKVGTVLNENKLEYLPEAHCYIRFEKEAIDVTTMTSSFDSIREDVIEEHVIHPDQVVQYKVEYHQEFLKQWKEKNDTNTSFEALWAIREACIAELEA